MSYERSNIQAMTGYSSGEQPDDERTIKLNTNENPYPPSPAVDDIISQFSGSELRRYPSPFADRFRNLAARIHQVTSANIIATRGGDELLRLVITTFVDPGETIAMSDPTYSLYPVLAKIQNCPILQLPLEQDWNLPEQFASQANDAGAKLTLIVNPHAPSGYLLAPSRIRELASSLNSILLIDEAYVDFIDPTIGYDCLSLVHEFDNLIFLRSLSKGYSLAGLRFGYGIGHVDLIRPMLEKTLDSYNLDVFSQQIAEAALADQQYASETWRKVRLEKKRIQPLLNALGLQGSNSESNFLLLSVDASLSRSASEIYQLLKQRHILVRYFDAQGLDDKLRITIGKPSENDQLIGALKEILQG